MRRTARIAVVALATMLTWVALIVSPPAAWACSCRPITTQQAFDDADAVFRGTVTERSRVGHGKDARLELRFSVSQAWRGSVYADQVVSTASNGSAACGIDAEVGSTWLIFATQTIEGTGDRLIARLTTSLCHGNLPAGAVPSWLGRGHLPQPGASDTEERSVRADIGVGRALRIAGLGALGVVVLGGTALLLLWRRTAA